MESDGSSSPKNYYVESPSRDSHSHDETDDKFSSDRSSPYYSPSHPRTSAASTNFSRLSDHRRRRFNKHYCELVPEEPQDDAYSTPIGRIVYLILSIILTILAAFVVLWAAAMPFKPNVTLKSVWVHNLEMGQGSDRSGVPTRLVWVNCSVNLAISNTATFYGIHVSSPYASLLLSQVTIAKGQMQRYYQPRRSHRSSWVTFLGKGVPIYGAGASISGSRGIPIGLKLEIESQGYIFGRMLRSTHRRHIACSLFVDPRRTQHIKFLKKSCKYT